MAGQTWAFQVLAIWALKRARRFMGGTPWRGGFTGRTPWRGCFLEGRPVCSADPSSTSLALKPLAGALRGAPWRMGSDRGRAGSFPRCPCRGGRARWGASPEWHHPALAFDQSSGQVSPSCVRPVPWFPRLVRGDVHPEAAAVLSGRSLCTRGNTVAFYSALTHASRRGIAYSKHVHPPTPGVPATRRNRTRGLIPPANGSGVHEN